MARVTICLDDLRAAIRDIKNGDIDSAIIYLRRAFCDDIEVMELIENKWWKQ